MAKTNKTTSEDIIEKREGSPVETACLIFSCLALLGAIAINTLESVGYREGLNPSVEQSRNPANVVKNAYMRSFNDTVAELDGILKGTVSVEGVEGEGLLEEDEGLLEEDEGLLEEDEGLLEEDEGLLEEP